MDKDRDGADRVANSLRGEGGTAESAAADVGNPEEVNTAFQQIRQDFGTASILVNCAGIVRDHKLSALTDEAWQQVLRINLTSCFYTCRAVADDMRTEGYGRIVNIASRAWLGSVGQANYAASKGGIVSLTRSLALELAPYGITSNCVAPGFIDTPMTRSLAPHVWTKLEAAQPGGKAGKPEDVAYAVAFLADSRAQFITGQTLYVCGGKSVLSSLS